MQKEMYDMIHAGEQGWWYAGRRLAVHALCARAGFAPHGVGLDYGAGFGGMYPVFAGCEAVDALEVHPDAVTTLRESDVYRSVFEHDSDVLAHSKAYDVLGVFDVLEHIEDDTAFLRHAHAVLRTDGTLMGTVPAHPFLFGKHDTQNMHFRRYTKRELVEKLTRAGFEVRAISYWNMALFPVAVLLRLFGSKSGGTLSPHPLIDKTLRMVVTCEAFLIRHIPLPTGLSLAFVARKKK